MTDTDNDTANSSAAASAIPEYWAPKAVEPPEPKPEPAPAAPKVLKPEDALIEYWAPKAVVFPLPEPELGPKPIYEYRYVRVRQNAWDAVEQAVLSQGAAAVAEAGGRIYGLWLGQIGLSANQGVVVTVWPSLDSARSNGIKALVRHSDVTASEPLYLEATARPLAPTAPNGPGMFAHRVFDVRRDDAERFIALSTSAWPQFEQVFGAQICALWRETGHDRAMDRLILLTRYPDYAAWEASRFWRPEPNPNAAEALQRFRERRDITVDTVVYTTRLASAATG